MPFAGWCFLVALFAELGGVALIVSEAIRKRNAAGSYRQIAIVNKVMQILISARYRVAWAVALLVPGIAAGTVGNFASL
jgi:hypothetical protein